jgi:hypothetical protein
MKVVKRILDGTIVYRSDPEFAIGVGIQNAINIFGGLPADYVEVDILQNEWDAFNANQPVVIRASSISTNFPSWTVVSNAINNISNIADAKAILLGLARVVYWLAKNSQN